MSKKVKVTKVEIEIGDSKQMLTLAQARELRDVLNEAFPEDTRLTYPIVIHDWSRPYHYWTPTWSSPSYTTNGITTTTNMLQISANTAVA